MRYHNTTPGFYSDIGKNARDLLYKDYARQPPTYFKYHSIEWNFDLSCETQEILPGLTPLFRFTIPDSSKVELRYTDDYLGLTAGVGVKASKKGLFSGNASYNPILTFSGIVGPTSLFSIGADTVFNASTKMFDDFTAGLSFKFSRDSPVASLNFEDKLDTLRASFYYSFIPDSRTAIAAEVKHSLSRDQATTYTVGMQHELFESIFLKTRIDTDATFGAFIQLELWEKLLFAVAGEFDFRTSDKKLSKLGLSLSYKP